MAGILNLIPRYLPRFGMSPAWVSRARPLVLLVFAFDVVITLAFQADVNAQGGAYATGVLVLMLSAAVAVTLALWREARTRALYFLLTSCVFVFVLERNVRERPDGVIIASFFVAFIVVSSVLSRSRRSTELRVERFVFADAESAEAVRFDPREEGRPRPDQAHGKGGPLGKDPGGEGAAPDRGPVRVPPREPARRPERVRGEARDPRPADRRDRQLLPSRDRAPSRSRTRSPSSASRSTRGPSSSA